MGRVAAFAVTAGVMFFLASCHASISVWPTGKAHQAKADPSCVSVRTTYGQSYGVTPVATCQFASALQTSTDRLEQRVRGVASATQRSLEDQQGELQGLQGDVAALQGNDSVLRPVIFRLARFIDAPVCEIYTSSEALEFARFGFRDENPNVHFVHLPCGDDCPELHMRYLPNCYRPNDDTGPFVSPLYECMRFTELGGPRLGEPACTHTVFLSNRGYTTNRGELNNRDDWLVLDQFEGFFSPSLFEGSALSSDGMAAMAKRLAAGDITPAEAAAIRDELGALQSDL